MPLMYWCVYSPPNLMLCWPAFSQKYRRVVAERPEVGLLVADVGPAPDRDRRERVLPILERTQTVQRLRRRAREPVELAEAAQIGDLQLVDELDPNTELRPKFPVGHVVVGRGVRDGERAADVVVRLVALEPVVVGAEPVVAREAVVAAHEAEVLRVVRLSTGASRDGDARVRRQGLRLRLPLVAAEDVRLAPHDRPARTSAVLLVLVGLDAAR